MSKRGSHGWLASGAMSMLLSGGRLVLNLVVQKIVVLWIGAAGLAQLGQFQTVLGLFQAISAGGGQDGLVKLASEHRNEIKLQPVTAFSVFTTVMGVVLGVVLFFCAPYFIEILKLPQAWTIAFRISALLMFLSGPYICRQSHFMGIGLWKPLMLIQGTAALTPPLVLIILKVFSFDITAFSPFAFSVVPLTSFAAVLLLQRQQLSRSILQEIPLGILLRKFWHSFARLTAISLPAIIVGPISLLVIRHLLVMEFGWKTTGLYQALQRFFDLPIITFSSFLGLYYLPSLGMKSEGNRFKLWKGYTWRVWVVLVCGCLLLALMGSFQKGILQFFFSAEISVPNSWYYLFTLNTFLKLWVWILCLQLLTLEAWKTFWIVEVLGAVLWIGVSHFWIRTQGVNGILMSDSFSNIIVLIILHISLFRQKRMCTSEA